MNELQTEFNNLTLSTARKQVEIQQQLTEVSELLVSLAKALIEISKSVRN